MSALKTWSLFFGVGFLLAACSDDSSPSKASIEDIGDAGSSSSSEKSSANDENKVSGSGNSSAAETIVINGGKDTIYVADAEGSLYYSSGVFCWTEGCEQKYAPSSSSAANPNSSSTKGSGNSSSSKTVTTSSQSVTPPSSAAAIPPTVTDNEMTDNRDGKKYKIEKIDGVTWMAENLKYEMSSGTYCTTTEVTKPGLVEEKELVDVCEKFGVYYRYAYAKVACPTGWRLPTKAETEAALASMEEMEKNEKDDWWILGGRFKLEEVTTFGNNGNQGYLWIQTSSSGEVVLQVQDYGTFQSRFLTTGADARAYNVRCVTTE